MRMRGREKKQNLVKNQRYTTDQSFLIVVTGMVTLICASGTHTLPNFPLYFSRIEGSKNSNIYFKCVLLIKMQHI